MKVFIQYTIDNRWIIRIEDKGEDYYVGINNNILYGKTHARKFLTKRGATKIAKRLAKSFIKEEINI